MTTKHRVCDTTQLSDEGSRIITEIEEVEIAVFNIDGEYHAIPNFCIHQGAPLCEGELTGQMTVGEDGREWIWDDDEKVITCPWHAWKFDVTTGKNIRDERYKIPRYEVEIEDGTVFVHR